MMTISPHVRIFIGDPVQYESEHRVLEFVHRYLSQRSEWAFLLANFNIGEVQIDLLIATANNTVVVEAKTYALPVRGGINGPWELAGPKRPKPTRNAYVQALVAKNTLRDTMREYEPDTGYPDAAVCIPKGVPIGSEIPVSDFKVGLGSLDELVSRLELNRGCNWKPSSWEQLISGLCLQEASSVATATSEDLFHAKVTLARYRKAFLSFYDSGDRYVPDEYRYADDVFPFHGLERLVEQSKSVLIRGPSGCGKTLVARKLAVAHLHRNGIPVFISAKNFDGTLRRSIDSEIGLLDTSGPIALLRSARMAGAPLLLVVDGYNECNESLMVALTRGAAAFALRYGASVLLTSQALPARADLILLAEVTVGYPSLAMKQELANLSASDVSAAAKGVLLESVSSCLDAVLVGQVGRLVSEASSRFVLYDAYVRLRLGAHAYEGVRCLCALANLLVRRASFRISDREFDRLLGDEEVGYTVIKKMERANIILRRSNQVSFEHELFFASFSAEGVIRDAKGSSDCLLKALASPRYHASKTFIVGAIEDQALLTTVLADCLDSDVYVACLKGECGIEANQWILRRIEALFTKMRAEARHVRFELGDGGWHGVHVCEDSTVFLPDEMEPFLSVIAHGLSHGRFLQETLAIIRHMEVALASSAPVLIAEAREKKIPLKSAMFADAYVMGRRTGISQLVASIHSGALSFVREPSQALQSVLKDA